MPAEQLSYAALAERLGISPEAARSLAKRHHLPRTRGNDGRTLVLVDVAEIEHRPVTGRSPGPVVAGLEERIATLDAELAAERAELTAERSRSAGHRADYERERDRADTLVDELRHLREQLVEHRPVAELAAADLRAITAEARAAAAEAGRDKADARADQLVADLNSLAVRMAEVLAEQAMPEPEPLAPPVPWWQQLWRRRA